MSGGQGLAVPANGQKTSLPLNNATTRPGVSGSFAKGDTTGTELDAARKNQLETKLNKVLSDENIARAQCGNSSELLNLGSVVFSGRNSFVHKHFS